jgi:methanogenic corrinoid protein MtbC1
MGKKTKIDELTSALGISLAEQLEAALNADDVAILQDFLCWKRTHFLSRGFSEADIAILFEDIRQTFSKGMEINAAERVSQFIDEAIRSLDCENSNPQPIDDGLQELSDQYRTFLLNGDRHAASQIILDTAASGTPVQDIYTQVFQNSLYEVGRLWQTNQITIAQEHFFTAATQMIMSQLYPYIFSNAKNGLRMIAASVDSNMHDIGIRMVADFFEMDGWDTYFLGGNAPYQAIVQALADSNPHLLALSVTIAKQIVVVENVIKTIREEDRFNHIKVIVGGPPFNISHDLWKKIGSDGFARSADEAVSLAREMFGLENTR